MKPRENSSSIHRESFGFLVQLIARRISADLKDLLSEKDIDINVFGYLLMLGEGDGITQRQLGDKLGFPDYFTSRNIDALAKSGFVERQANPESRRSFLIFLTEKGRERADELPEIIQKCNDNFLEPLPEKERTILISLLQKLCVDI